MKLHLGLLVGLTLICSGLIRSAALADDTGPYKLLKSVTVGGDGGWDYLNVDADNRKIYISRGNRFDVFDADTLNKVGEIPDTNGCHGVAIDPVSGHGFTSNGRDPSVTMFDAKTLNVIQKITVTGRPDGIFYEPFTKHIFVESHAQPNETVIDPANGTVVGMIDLGGEPEQGVPSDAKWTRLYQSRKHQRGRRRRSHRDESHRPLPPWRRRRPLRNGPRRQKSPHFCLLRQRQDGHP